MADWTIEAWVKPLEPVATGSCILGLQTISASNILTVTGTEQRSWSVVYGPDEQTIPHSAWTGNPDGLFNSDPQHLGVSHEVVSNSKSKLTLFLNGTERATWFVGTEPARAQQDWQQALPVLLGACHGQPRAAPGQTPGRGIFRERFFRGHLDEVRWWGRRLFPDQIAVSWQWSGAPDQWPPEDFVGGFEGLAAVAARAGALNAQYSMDVLTRRLHDGGHHGRHGWRGTAGKASHSPRYVRSAFQDLSYGSIFRGLREGSSYQLDFLPLLFSFGGPTYNGLLIVQQASNATLQETGTGLPIGTGSLVSGLAFRVETHDSVDYDSIVVRPCVGQQGLAPELSACSDQRRYDVSLEVTASRAPIPGRAHAIQLLQESAFLRLPGLPPTATLEFWVQLLPPLLRGGTLLSAREAPGAAGTLGREILRVSLDPPSGGAVLEVCAAGSGGPRRLPLPGLATAAPQHVALAWEHSDGSGAGGGEASGWNYTITAYRDGALLLRAVVEEPCLSLASPKLLRPTLGARYTGGAAGDALGASEEPRSEDFAPMYVAELRVWNHSRGQEEIAALMNERLEGNETGLVAYAQVTSKDRDAAEAGDREVLLQDGRQGTRHRARPAAGAGDGRRLQRGRPQEDVSTSRIEVRCAADDPHCPNFTLDSGFVVRPSPFALPPETATVETAGRTDVDIPLVGYDLDNFQDDKDTPSDVDAIKFEIIGFPDPKCGYIYGNGDELYIRTEQALEVITENRLPLRFVPFGGATIAEEIEMGGTCTTELKYRARDSQGLRSLHVASVHIKVWRAGVTFTSASASGLRASTTLSESFALQRLAGTEAAASLTTLGGVLRLDFSGPTNAPANVDARGLLEVLNGSWGTSSPRLAWVGDGATLLIELDRSSSSLGATLVPGRTRFRVRRSAGLRVQGDSFSAPCEDVSPLLAGDFTKPSCSPGFVLNMATAACDACPSGTFWSANGGGGGGGGAAPGCAQCPEGRSSATPGALACEPCAPGRYMPGGAANRSSCLPAPPGTFVAAAGATAPVACMRGALAARSGQRICSACPDHGDCSVPGFVGTQALADPGYLKVADGVFLTCRIPGACMGAGTCAVGHRTPALGCYPCARGFARASGAVYDAQLCSRCPSRQRAVAQAAAVLIFTLLLAFCLAKLNIAAARRPACLHVFILKLATDHMLLMSSFSTIEGWELAAGFGGAAATIHRAMRVIFALDGRLPAHLIHVDCLLDEFLGDKSTEERLWITLGIWALLLPAMILACLLISALIVSAAYCMQALGCIGGRSSSSTGGAPSDVMPVDSVVPVFGTPKVWAPGGEEIEVAAHEDPTAVPSGWEAVWSEDHSRYYYHNRSEGTSTWIRPIFVPSSPGTSPKHSAHGEDAHKARHYDYLADTLEYRVCGIWRLKPGRRAAWAAFLQDSLGVLISITALAYPAVLRQLMAFVRCDDLSGAGESVLLVAPDVLCGGAAQTKLAVAAWLGLVFWGAGVPAAAYWLCFSHSSTIGHFSSRVSWGLLFAQYERKWFCWESLILLVRLAAATTCLSPAAPQELRLVLLLVVGNVASFMHHACEPFDNQSGVLLDTLECQALRLFCATAAAVLLGMSRTVNPDVCAAVLAAALTAHLLFLLKLLRCFLRHLRRSIADGAVAAHMQGRAPGFLAKYMFRWEARVRKKQAHVNYLEDVNAIEVAAAPGEGNREVRDHEQYFVACGLADCVVHAVAECKVDRLSVQFLEYVGRTTFALNSERLQREVAVKRERPPSVRPPSGGQPASPQSPASCRSFDSETFQVGMLAGDFQGALNEACLSCPREQLEQAFHDFMVSKGLGALGNYDLNPRERMLKNFENGKMAMPQAFYFARQTQKLGGHDIQLQLVDVEEDEAKLQLVDVEEDEALAICDVEETDRGSQGAGPGSRRRSPGPAKGHPRGPRRSKMAGPSRHSLPPSGVAPARRQVDGRPPGGDDYSLPNAVQDPPAQSKARAGNGRIEVVPWGVLGRQRSRGGEETQAAPEPDHETAVVDPGGPTGAGGAAGAIYRWLGLDARDALPAEVRSAVAQELDAKLHDYAGRHVVHVASPDFRDLAYQGQPDEALEALSLAYRNVLAQFAASGLPRLRMLPISDGVLSGEYEDELPDLIAKALQRALHELPPQARRGVRAASALEFCTFTEADFDRYKAALSAELG